VEKLHTSRHKARCSAAGESLQAWRREGRDTAPSRDSKSANQIEPGHTGSLGFASASDHPGRKHSDQATAGVALTSPFNGERAFTDLRRLVAFGLRPSGSPALVIVRELGAAGAGVTEDEFIVKTPIGPIPMTNILAKIAGAGLSLAPGALWRQDLISCWSISIRITRLIINEKFDGALKALSDARKAVCIGVKHCRPTMLGFSWAVQPTGWRIPASR